MGRKAVVTAGAALVVGSMLVAPATASAASDAFRGTWTSTDVDGSSQWLAIGGSGSAGLHSVRGSSTTRPHRVCGLPASVAGQGSTAGDTLTMTGVLTCRPGGNPLRFRITVEFVYSPGSDTLADSFGVIWQRT